MTNKIDDLFFQVLDEVVPQTWTSLSYEQVSRLKDKFAKLLIEQAILAVETKTNTHHIYTTFDDHMVKHTIINSAKAIKEHFGIEQ